MRRNVLHSINSDVEQPMSWHIHRYGIEKASITSNYILIFSITLVVSYSNTYEHLIYRKYIYILQWHILMSLQKFSTKHACLCHQRHTTYQNIECLWLYGNDIAMHKMDKSFMFTAQIDIHKLTTFSLKYLFGDDFESFFCRKLTKISFSMAWKSVSFLNVKSSEYLFWELWILVSIALNVNFNLKIGCGFACASSSIEKALDKLLDELHTLSLWGFSWRIFLMSYFIYFNLWN